MRLRIAWIIARKELDIFRKKRSIVYSTILFPLIASVGMPQLLHFGIMSSVSVSAADVPDLLNTINAFAFFFIIGAAVIPTTIASYSLIGEKDTQSLEPLLAAPVTDAEILLGKTIGALVPPLAGIWIGGIIFMAFMDAYTSGVIGYLYYPNAIMAVIMLLLVPLTAITSVELSVISSARAGDVRTAQQMASLIVLPFVVIYVLGLVGSFPLTVPYLLLIAAIILVVDLGLFRLSMATFSREEILTTWR